MVYLYIGISLTSQFYISKDAINNLPIIFNIFKNIIYCNTTNKNHI